MIQTEPRDAASDAFIYYRQRAGREVVKVAERVPRDLEGLRLIGKEYSSDDVGEFTVATTHTHARYSLPRAIEASIASFPK